eukprot:scaffold134453_cov24-Tisochrysis_lutea.AAC.2
MASTCSATSCTFASSLHPALQLFQSDKAAPDRGLYLHSLDASNISHLPTFMLAPCPALQLSVSDKAVPDKGLYLSLRKDGRVRSS